MRLVYSFLAYLILGYHPVNSSCLLCSWRGWSSWGGCSSPCGGGTQVRTRLPCCIKSWFGSGSRCFQSCAKHPNDGRQSQSCNRFCYNGGTLYTWGCRCPETSYGDCCSSRCPMPRHCERHSCTNAYNTICRKCEGQGSDIDNSLYWLTPDKKGCDVTCSWKENWCWPGTCPEKLAKNCICGPGFSLISNEPAKCGLSRKPDLITCRLGVDNNGSEIRNSTNEGSVCEKEKSFYVNFQPTSMFLRLESYFSLPPEVFNISKPWYIKEYALGIVKTEVNASKVEVDGYRSFLRSADLEYGSGCDQMFNQSLPLAASLVSCARNIRSDVSWNLKDGEQLCLLFVSKAGGYLKTIDFNGMVSSYQFYDPTQSVHDVCAKYDNSKPIHCSEQGSCRREPIQLVSRITVQPQITVNISGWLDPYPLVPDQASGIQEYTITLHDVKEVDNATLIMDTSAIQTFKNAKVTQDIELPTEPALYGISVIVVDVAGNPSVARRFVLYDNSSIIKVHHGEKLRFDSANPSTNFTWQTNYGEICLSWPNRYYNSYNVNFNLLRHMAPDYHGLYKGVYEQHSGLLPVSGTPNVHGIIQFLYTWSKNNEKTSSQTLLPNVTKQKICRDYKVKDGDTVNLTVISVDIMENTFSESLQVFIDASVPDINDIWLIRDGLQKLYVHNSTDLSKMKIEFEALDQHSGLHSIEWYLGTTVGGNEIGYQSIGVQNIANQEKFKTTSSCYCPEVGPCEKLIYTADFNSLVHDGNNIGNHNREYFFTLKVTNKAMLVSIQRTDILVDDSKPEAGVAFEGVPNSPDIDYTADDEVMINWHGFLDHESGIMKYRVGLNDHCMDHSELQHNIHNLTGLEYLTETKQTSIKVKIPGTGKYYTSIIAYNNALEPSNVVCSDGITLDTSKPHLQNLKLENARTNPIVGCFNNSVYFVSENLTAVEMTLTEDCKSFCNRSREMTLLQFLPKSPHVYNDTDIADDMCRRQKRFTDDWFMYLPSDRIFMEWSTYDPESQMREVEVGYASDSTQFANPDLSSYAKTHRMLRYSSVHSGLDTGSPLYIMIRATNKAGLQTNVPFGPLVIDETPPIINEGPNVEVHGENIIVSWRNYSFQDPEEMTALQTLLFKLGNNETFLTPTLQAQILHQSPINVTGSLCFLYPVQRVQKEDTEKGLMFYFELYVYNTAGHFTSVRTPHFIVPSRYPPGHGTVIDIDINSTDPTLDADFIFASNNVCARWDGFSHHENVTYELGIGSSKGNDDVVPYQVVSGTSACIASNFDPFLKYFTTVRASCSGGTITVSSDGFIVINETQALQQVHVYDGEPCSDESLIMSDKIDFSQTNITFNISKILNSEKVYSLILPVKHDEEVAVTSDDAVWITGEHDWSKNVRSFLPIIPEPSFLIAVRGKSHNVSDDFRKIKILNCNKDQQVQRSRTSYKGYWTVDSKINKRITHYEVGLFKFEKGIEEVIQPLTPVYNQSSVVINDIHLEYNKRYSLVLQVCFQHVCLKSIYSEGSVVELTQPIVRDIHVTMQKINKTFVDTTVTLDLFECGVSTRADTYLYAFSNTIGGDNQITKWYRVIGQTNMTSGRLTARHITYLPVYHYQDIFVCMRGICRSGASTRTCTKADMTTHPNDFDSNVLYEIDTNSCDLQNIKNLLHSRHIGRNLAELHKRDVDFIKPGTRLSGALTNSAGRVIEWYLMKNPTIPAGPCSDDTNCIQHVHSESGIATFRRWNLQTNRKYFICAYSNSSYIDLERTPENPAEFKICGNGFVVDGSPPLPGDVEIETERGFISDNEVLISWSGFSDIERDVDIEYRSGILSYAYAVVTYPGGKDISQYTNVGLTRSAILHNITIKNGLTIYASVKAYDFVGHTTVVTSHGATVDMTPPVRGLIRVGNMRQQTYFVSSKSIQIEWNGFEDPESGIEQINIGVGSSNLSADVRSMERYDDEYVLIENDDGFVDGHQYYALISVTNRAGLTTTVASPPFVVDRTSPVAGYVRDGRRTQKAEVDYQRDITELSSHWDGFTDPHSGVSYYEVGIGTYPLQVDVEEMVNVGLRTDKTWRNLFIPGTKYYITVRACNGAGLCSTSSSDGVILDNSPPIPGIVHVGLSDRHQHYLSHRSSISAQWFGFQDPHSYIQYFEWCLGTTKESCDLHKFENVLLSNSIVKTGLDLPNNTAMYVTVRAYNNLVLYTQRSSEAFFVDTTPPIVKRKPYFVLNKNSMSHRPNSQWESSFIEFAWEFYDLESPVTGHSILLKNHETGHTVIDSISVANENSTTIRLHNDNVLKSGDRYTAWVTACNAAALCISAKTNDILIDATPPHLGGFKNPMTWQTVNESERLTEIDVQWYGFVDAESDIEGYYLTVSRNYSDSELSGGIVQVESQNSSGQTKAIRLTEYVENRENIVLSVWTVNKVGLRSSIGRVTVTLVANDVEHDSGFLEIQQHSCTSQYCNNDCTCAVIGLKCIGTLGNSPCTEIKANTTSSYQAVDVKFGRKPKQTKVTGSSLCLEGYWTLLNPNVFPVMRFEWSMGVKDEKPGTGIFVEFKEAVWYDVGKYTNITHCLTNGKRLEHNELYVLYVKAWYSYTDYMVFTSDPVLVDLTPPTVRRGASVFESVDGCSTDIDFLNATFDFVVCWSRVFSESVNNTIQYAIAGGSSPFGDDVLNSVSVGTHTFYNIKGSLLQPGTTYYFTVLAKNSIGLITSLVSDGVLIDLDKPSSGVVFNTKHHRNVLQQSVTDHIGISWHGFDDHHSSIGYYLVSIVDSGSGERVVNTDTSGITNSIVIDHLSLLHNHHYQAEVVAYDAAGHASDKVTSEQVLIDSTSPKAYTCSRYEEMGELNTTITVNDHLHGQHKVYIQGNTDVSKDDIYELLLFISDPIISGTVQAQFDENLLSIPAIENWNGSVRVEYKFISPRDGEMDISMYFCQDTKYNPRAHLRLRRCVSMSVANEHAVQVKQLSPNTLSFFTFVTDDESGLKLVQLGAGLTRGGYQIRALSLASRDSLTSLVFDAPHGSKVFVTLMVENNANLMSVFTSDPLVVDHTKPDITDPTASLTTTEKCLDTSNTTSENVNGSISSHSSSEISDDIIISNRSIFELTIHSVMLSDIDVWWKVTDPESGVLECHCSAGVDPDSTTIQDWKPGKENKQCQINDLSLPHGTAVYVNIRCINKVQLSHVVHYGPMIVSFESPEATEAEADFVLDNRRSNIHNDPSTDVQSNTSLIHFYWDGFQDVSGITYETRLTTEGRDVYPWSDNSHRTFKSYAVRSNSPSLYTAHVRARNSGTLYSLPVNKTITLLASGPKLTGQQAHLQLSDGSYVIKWTDVFESSLFGSLLYWVSVGSQEGYIDIHRPTSTLRASINVIMDRKQYTTMFVSVTAFDTNAEFTKYSKMFKI